MKAITGHIFDVWQTGQFIGSAGRSHARVTVEPAWRLNESSGTVGGLTPAGVPGSKLPIRYFVSTENPRTEMEIPNIKTIHISRNIDQDAATCEISIYNQGMGNAYSSAYVGSPGYFTFGRGAAGNPWGHTQNSFADILVPNALLRTYQGYGGNTLSKDEAVAQGYIIQTGTWLVDEVRITTDGMIQLRCRDMAKLLIDQFVFPPLIPRTRYPLHYNRYNVIHHSVPPVAYGVTVGNARIVVGGVPSNAATDAGGTVGLGYWLVGDDGGVFAFGSADFFGSNGGFNEGQPICGMATTAHRDGYWVARRNGSVLPFGTATMLGQPGTRPTSFVAIESSHSGAGEGYYMLDALGEVYAYGVAQYRGGSPVTPKPMVDMAAMPSGDGYRLVNENGQVYAYGTATYLGGTPNNTGQKAVCIVSTNSGHGYWIVDSGGHVYAFGDAGYFGGTASMTINDPITDLIASPNENGYWLVGQDGGVYAFGPQFYGSLVGGFENDILVDSTDGPYRDFTDIVKDLLLWTGWWLHPETDGGLPVVYGNLESTNTFAISTIPEDVLDKRPIIDTITQLKETVGYIFFIDDEGAVRFKLPNYFTLGNNLQDGTHTLVVPLIDERFDMISYGASFNDDAVRTQVVVSSQDPTTGSANTVNTVITPPTSVNLRGMQKPAMYINELFTDAETQRIMAELIGIHLFFQQRLGAVECVANPLFEIDDQVQIREEQTSEFFVHYIRSIDTVHNLDTGSYRMSLTTHHLGDTHAFLVQQPT